MKMITYLTTALLLFLYPQIGLCQPTDIEHKFYSKKSYKPHLDGKIHQVDNNAISRQFQKLAPEQGVDANKNESVAIMERKESVVDSSNNNPTYFPCYTVSENNAAPNTLFKFNASTGNWTKVGITGSSYIEAIATDPISDIIYATDAGIFGTINAITAVFTAIGTGISSSGYAMGAHGSITLDDIDGLTFDPVNQIMYGTHRVIGNGPGTNDLLFQIDVSTGTFVPEVMIDTNTESAADYAVIPVIFEGTFKKGNAFYNLYDVDDIAYSPYAGQLFALHSQDGPGVISVINTVTAELEGIVFDMSYYDDDVEGIGFSPLGQLYGTKGNNGFYNGFPATEENNTFLFIDLVGQTTETIGKIDPDDGVPPAEQVDFEAFDCFTAYNDLALLLEVASPLQQPIIVDSLVTFLLTVFNQGDYANSNITITNYIPKGLSLADNNWSTTNNGEATYIFEEAIEPGEDSTVEITYTVEPDFEGETITNTVEISASYSPSAIDLQGNQIPYPLPDLDSYPNNINDEYELTVEDNEINGGGPNANQDEDDHDIAIIKVQQVPCPAYLVIPDGEISGYFKAQQEIDIRGFVEKTKPAEFDICK